MSTMDDLFSDFVTKRYADVSLEELGENYKGKVLKCWVNPPAYTDQLIKERMAASAVDGMRSLTFERWLVGTCFELDAAKVKEIPDKVLVFLALKADKEYAAYQDTVKNLSRVSEPPATI